MGAKQNVSLLQWNSEKATGFCSPSHKVKTQMAVKPEAAKQQESLFNMLDQRHPQWCEQAGNLHTGAGRAGRLENRSRRWRHKAEEMSRIQARFQGGETGHRKSLCQVELESLACEKQRTIRS